MTLRSEHVNSLNAASGSVFLKELSLAIQPKGKQNFLTTLRNGEYMISCLYHPPQSEDHLLFTFPILSILVLSHSPYS